MGEGWGEGKSFWRFMVPMCDPEAEETSHESGRAELLLGLRGSASLPGSRAQGAMNVRGGLSHRALIAGIKTA
jgi:hypothetical protein